MCVEVLSNCNSKKVVYRSKSMEISVNFNEQILLNLWLNEYTEYIRYIRENVSGNVIY